MGAVYVVALPNLNIVGSSNIESRLGRLRSDFRGAFDMAVLNKKPFRLVFMLVSGDYWLETTDAKLFSRGDFELQRDLTTYEERERAENFDTEFELYEELAGEEINDPDSDRVLRPESPLLRAKDKLRPAKWRKVEDAEWGLRQLGPELIIQDIKTEHHEELFTFQDLGEDARAMVYFLPSGYVEKAVLHIAFRRGEDEISEDELPYTVTTQPFQGTIDVVTGYEEVDLEQRDK